MFAIHRVLASDAETIVFVKYRGLISSSFNHGFATPANVNVITVFIILQITFFHLLSPALDKNHTTIAVRDALTNIVSTPICQIFLLSASRELPEKSRSRGNERRALNYGRASKI